MDQKPTILVVNDDGYEASGLEALVEVARQHGHVTVIAPNSSRSGSGHGITMSRPLRIKLYKKKNGVNYYRTSGTPVDCVKLGQKVVLRNQKIDLVLSGINHGSNSSVSLLYSGTMAAAIEASFENLKSVGFSLLNYSSQADFSASKIFVDKIITEVLAHEMPPFICLNVNIPKLPLENIRGIKITRQAPGFWNEDLEERFDPFGRPYYWLAGHLEETDPQEGTCQWALRNGYVSVQPVQFDMTAHQYISSLNFIEK
ncbi:MAG: 5'/3'-nucleotidase SurE [Bacteroidales bacterium]|jgi:5'-nucleotidase|nr:5'/3'-nucleotidase SurE [Bacteroidales bacterium]